MCFLKEILRDTVSNVIEDLVIYVRAVTDYLISNVGLTQVQVDKMWSFVKKSPLLEMQGDVGQSSGPIPVLHQFYPNPFSIEDLKGLMRPETSRGRHALHGRENY